MKLTLQKKILVDYRFSDINSPQWNRERKEIKTNDQIIGPHNFRLSNIHVIGVPERGENIFEEIMNEWKCFKLNEHSQTQKVQ
jgi:hypothetical protein